MKRLNFYRFSLFGITACLISSLFFSGVVLAVGNASIGGKPANPRPDNPRSQSIFVHELEPGSKTDDAIRVINNTDQTKTLLVYAVDSQIASDGAFACAQKADTPVSVGTWITLAESKVTLEPHSSKDVDFTIRVPDTASAGEQNGCIVVQDSERTPSPESNGLMLSFRSAVRVAITVPGDITKQLDFTGPVVVGGRDKIVQLSAGLKNNGNVSLDTAVEVRIRSFFGNTLRSAGGTFPVLARSEGVFNFEVDKPFWGGWYRVDATATYDSDPEYSLGESGESATITSPQKWVFVSPEPLALLVELLLLVAVLSAVAVWVLRRRRHQKLHARSVSYVVKKGDSLQSVAKKHGVSWKVVAKLNKLQAPYHIEPGQKLKIPGTER